jgi:hypothetical protein
MKFRPWVHSCASIGLQVAAGVGAIGAADVLMGLGKIAVLMALGRGTEGAVLDITRVHGMLFSAAFNMLQPMLRDAALAVRQTNAMNLLFLSIAVHALGPIVFLAPPHPPLLEALWTSTWKNLGALYSGALLFFTAGMLGGLLLIKTSE